MTDFTWLSAEAKNLHGIFQGVFYGLMMTFLTVGIILEYFKMPLGKVPAFGILVARVLLASLLLMSLPDVMNFISDITESLANKIGDLNNFKLVLAKMGEKLDEMSWSWISVKKSVILLISFISFLILYMSVYLAEAFYLYAWTLAYIFSPLMIAFYVFPQTERITISLYRTLFEVASWKVVWGCLSTLLWSSALMDLDKLSKCENFITIIIFNVMLALSVLLTPLLVRGVMSGGGISGAIAGLGATVTGGAMMAATKVRRATLDKNKKPKVSPRNSNHRKQIQKNKE